MGMGLCCVMGNGNLDENILLNFIEWVGRTVKNIYLFESFFSERSMTEVVERLDTLYPCGRFLDKIWRRVGIRVFL